MLFIGKSKNSLRKENNRLEKQLEDIKRKYRTGNIVQSKNAYSRDGYYANIESLPDYQNKWKNSFFDLHQDIAEYFSSGVLSSRYLNYYQKTYHNSFGNAKGEYEYSQFVVHCSAVIPSDEGPMLYLEDPFGYIISKPLIHTSIETAKSWINRILVIDLGLHYKKNDYPINRIRTLKYTLYD